MKYDICEKRLKGKPATLKEFAEALDAALQNSFNGMYLYVQDSGPKELKAFPDSHGRHKQDTDRIISEVLESFPKVEKTGPNSYRVKKVTAKKEKNP